MKSLACTLLADAIEQAARATAPAPVVPTMATGAPVERLRAYAAHDAEALAVLDRLAATPEVTTDLKAAALRHLAQLEHDYHLATPVRRGPLAKAILAAIGQLRIYFPPPPAQKTRDEVLDELLRLDEETRAMIEQHAPDPITAKDLQ